MKDKGGFILNLRLILYLSILLLGAILGYKDLISKKILSRLNTLQSISLLFLLFIMGIRIGVDEKVINSFLKLGFQAIIISVFSIFFSVLFVKLVRMVAFKETDKVGYKGES
ncbi:MAG: lysine exporter LysO family protein [Firmicutes bacterium]|nr:lysine exporter LysO family protein [Bacillota bacterium]